MLHKFYNKNIERFPGEQSFIVSRPANNIHLNFVSDQGTYYNPNPNQNINEGVPNPNIYAQDVVYDPASNSYISMLPTKDDIRNMNCSEISTAISKMFNRLESLPNQNLFSQYQAMITFAEQMYKEKNCAVIYKNDPPPVATNPINNVPVTANNIEAAMPSGIKITSPVVNNEINTSANDANKSQLKKSFPWLYVVIGAAVVVGFIGTKILFRK